MSNLIPYPDVKSPGVYVTESSLGITPAALVDHSNTYMLGFSSSVSAPKNIWYYCNGTDDFYNIFGANASSNSVQLYFDQQPGYGLWFLNVTLRTEAVLTIPSVTSGNVFTITVNGFSVSYTAVNADTPTTVLAALKGLVNGSLTYSASMYDGGILRYDSGATVTTTSNITMGSPTTASYPVVRDVIDSLRLASHEEQPQGFLIAPEFFSTTVSGWNLAARSALANAMGQFCADTKFFWMALVDCGNNVATASNAGGAINLALQEVSALSEPLGHMAYYFPYWQNLNGANVPMSASVAAVAMKRFRLEGFWEPPAGEDYPLIGVTGQSIFVSKGMQDQLNPANVNCGRMLTQQRGGGLSSIGVPVIYGARTISTDVNFRYVSVRVIMNVLCGTLKRAFRNVPFRTVDGIGVELQRISATASGICELMRTIGALYGNTAADAYLVVCNATNNTPDNLDAGRGLLQVYAKPSPCLEFLHIPVYRTPLGYNFGNIQSSGTNSQPTSQTSGKSGVPGTASTPTT